MKRLNIQRLTTLLFPLFISLCAHANSLNCASGSEKALSLGCIAIRLTGGATSVIDMLLGLSFVSGWCFIIAAIFKFKQVRENPTQVPVSTPFAFLLTAMLLIFIPGLMTTGAVTIFGNTFTKSPMSLTGQQAESIGLIEGPVQISQPTSNSLFGTAARLTQIFPDLMNVVIGSAYIAGLGFSIAAMIKLKAVRDNPQQNPVTMPIAYILIAILLVFMPSILRPVSETLFGNEEDVQAGAEGQGSTALIQEV